MKTTLPRYTHTQIAEARNSISHIFIRSRETEKTIEELKLRMEIGCRSTLNLKTSHQARLTALAGPSGFGKTALIEDFLKCSYVAEMEGKGFQVLHLALPPDCSIKSMTTEFLHEMNYALAHITSTAGRNSARIIRGLKEMNCKLILIDEAQHLLGKKGHSQQEATDWLKVLLDKAGVPVVVIGLPET
jgi:thymidine kinase